MNSLINNLSDTNRIFDALFKDHFDFYEPNKSKWAPKMDVIEHPNEYILEMELPGVSKADVELQVKGDRLTISGTKKSQREAQEGAEKVHIVESFSGQFSRTVRFGHVLDISTINAAMKDGILTIQIPKTEIKRIPIS